MSEPTQLSHESSLIGVCRKHGYWFPVDSTDEKCPESFECEDDSGAHVAFYAPVQPAGGPDTIERVRAALLDEFADWIVNHPNHGLFDWDVATQEIVAAVGPVGRSCEVTDAMVKQASIEYAISEANGTPGKMRRALEAALGAAERQAP